MFLAPVHTAVLCTSGVGGHAHVHACTHRSVVGLSGNSSGVFVAWAPQLKPQMLTQCGVSDKVSVCKNFPTPVYTHTHTLAVYMQTMKHCGEGSQC